MAATDLGRIPPPNAYVPVEHDVILRDILSYFRSKNPAYTSIVEGDPGYSVLEAIAYAVTLIRGWVNDSVLATMVLYASGADLDNLGVLFAKSRRVDETDEDFRLRIVASLEIIVPGSIDWYRSYAIESSETGEVVDVSVVRKADPANPGRDIAGSIVLYVQSKDDAIPTTALLQTVKNYVDATGASDTRTSVEKEAARKRRFICDNVEVEPIFVQPYVLRAKIVPSLGFEKQLILEKVHNIAQEFVDNHERINRKILLSDIYSALNIEEVREVVVISPTTTIESSDNEVLVAFREQAIYTGETDGIASYIDFNTDTNQTVQWNWDRFAQKTGVGWTLVEYNGKWNILFTRDTPAEDLAKIRNVVSGRRIGIHGLIDNEVELDATLVVRVDSEMQEYIYNHVGVNRDNHAHYYFTLTEEPTLTDLTLGDQYKLVLMSSVEITL